MVVVEDRFDALLCDLDGVIRHWPADQELEARHGLPAGALARAAFAPARLLPAVTGAVGDARWRESVAEELAEVCGSLARARVVVAEWGSASRCTVDLTVLDLLARARRHVPVVLVTNATTRLDEDLRAADLLSRVDAVVNSSRVGVAKPDPRIYQIAAETAGVPVTRCLFVDDSRGNVDAARARGMWAVHYQNPDQLRAELARARAG